MAKKEYTNGEVTVVWQSDLCIHSENCFKGLSKVFNPNQRPWVNIEGASSQQIMDQVEKCPSGALSYYKNGEKKKEDESPKGDQTKVEVSKNGPLMVHGQIEVQYPDGKSETKKKVTVFCRCGSSGNKPFCDGSHKRVGFEG